MCMINKILNVWCPNRSIRNNSFLEWDTEILSRTFCCPGLINFGNPCCRYRLDSKVLLLAIIIRFLDLIHLCHSTAVRPMQWYLKRWPYCKTQVGRDLLREAVFYWSGLKVQPAGHHSECDRLIVTGLSGSLLWREFARTRTYVTQSDLIWTPAKIHFCY